MASPKAVVPRLLSKVLAPRLCAQAPSRFANRTVWSHGFTKFPKPVPSPRAHGVAERSRIHVSMTRVAPVDPCVRSRGLGANVIKMSSRSPAGATRWDGPAEGSAFPNLHRNKRRMTLNLKSHDAVADPQGIGQRPTSWV